ncbi:MAG: hypothetical protein AAFP10_00070 [Pseudomonadota bacterium]
MQKDIVTKSLIEELATCLVTRLLKIPVMPGSIEWLNTEQHRVEDRRADMVVRVQSGADAAPELLHLEIQNNNHAQMPLRMLRYYTDIRLRWPQEPLRQYLIYTGKKTLSMPAGLPEFNYHYELIDMRAIDCALLLSEDTPDALVLAILCDFKGRSAQNIVSYIIQRLYQLTHQQDATFRRYLHMLELLSENRDLQNTVKETEQMLTDFNIEQLPSFQIATQRGLEQGLEQGRELERTAAQARDYANRLHFATQLIGQLDDQQIAELFDLTPQTVAALH